MNLPNSFLPAAEAAKRRPLAEIADPLEIRIDGDGERDLTVSFSFEVSCWVSKASVSCLRVRKGV